MILTLKLTISRELLSSRGLPTWGHQYSRCYPNRIKSDCFGDYRTYPTTKKVNGNASQFSCSIFVSLKSV